MSVVALNLVDLWGGYHIYIVYIHICMYVFISARAAGMPPNLAKQPLSMGRGGLFGEANLEC